MFRFWILQSQYSEPLTQGAYYMCVRAYVFNSFAVLILNAN